MHQFKDTHGRTYSIRIDYGAIKRVQEGCNINLIEAIPRDTDSEESALIVEMDFNPVMMLDVVYHIIRPQLKEQEITAEAFGQAVDIDNHVEMSNAFWEAYKDFFQTIGRSQVVAAIEEQRSVSKQMIESAVPVVRRAAELTVKTYESKMDRMLEALETETSGESRTS